MTIRSKDVVYLSSLFESADKRVLEDRGIVWRMRKVLRQHRSKEWKKKQIYKLLSEFDGEDFKDCRRPQYSNM